MTPQATFREYPDLYRAISASIGAELTDCEHEYYPLNSWDPGQGFLEVIFPFVDSRGRLLRGAAGNGPIFVFLYRRGIWTYLGEMYGAKVSADIDAGITKFSVYTHVSSNSGTERQYSLHNGEYICISEVNIGT